MADLIFGIVFCVIMAAVVAVLCYGWEWIGDRFNDWKPVKPINNTQSKDAQSETTDGAKGDQVFVWIFVVIFVVIPLITFVADGCSSPSDFEPGPARTW